MVISEVQQPKDELHVVTLESDELKVTVLPEIGFKVASLVYKKNHFEALARPMGYVPGAELRALYASAFPGAAYTEYDRSGIDDCIPTVTECTVPNLGHFHDHGDAWSRPWNVFEENRTDRSVKAYFRLSKIPLYFERHVRMEGTSLILEYRMLNESVTERPWLWSLHTLAHYEPDAVLSWSGTDELLNALNDNPIAVDLHQISNVKEGERYKFYLRKPVDSGEAFITYPSQNMRLGFHWDSAMFPYLGGWVNRGLEGPDSLGLMPTNGFYDSLDLAIKNNMVGKIPAVSEITWQVRLELTELEEMEQA